jgi:DNA-binding transcriptional LysR family regulator
MLDKLEFLIALASERHFRRAAETVGVSQPTLSAGIKALEETLGVALVNRGSRYVGLTAEGEKVLAWARRLVGDARAMRQEVDVLKRGVVAGEVRLGVIPTALPVAARLVDRFGQAHPEVRFTVLSLSSNAILGMLEDFQIDGGLTYLDNEPLPQMAVTPMYLERYRLVTARAGPLGGRKTVTWAEIARLPLCLFTRDMQNRRIVEEMLARHAAGAAIDSMETNSSLVMTQLVMAGHWSSVMPPALIGAMPLPQEVATIPIIDPDMTHEVGLVMLDREPVTPTARALVRTTRELAQVLAL